MQQLESDLDVTQEKLMNANQRLRRKSAISKRRCNNWSPTLTLPKRNSKDANIRAKKAGEEVRDLQKKMQ